MQAAIDRRDQEEARRRDTTVESLRAEREEALIEDQNREVEVLRLERLGRDARLITPDDVKRVVAVAPDAMNGTKAWRIVERFIKSGRAFCVISGPRGVGKTVAACAAKARLGGMIISADELTRAQKNEHEEARELRGRIPDITLLVIDDLGLEGDIDAGVRALQYAVNERQGRGLRTLVTTNLSKKMLRERYDARTIERIEHGGALVEIPGESLRKKAS